MITNGSDHDDDRLTWKDIELLPLYGGALLLGVLIVRGMAEFGPELHDGVVKSALFLGLAGVQHWLGTNVGTSD